MMQECTRYPSRFSPRVWGGRASSSLLAYCQSPGKPRCQSKGPLAQSPTLRLPFQVFEVLGWFSPPLPPAPSCLPPAQKPGAVHWQPDVRQVAQDAHGEPARLLLSGASLLHAQRAPRGRGQPVSAPASSRRAPTGSLTPLFFPPPPKGPAHQSGRGEAVQADERHGRSAGGVALHRGLLHGPMLLQVFSATAAAALWLLAFFSFWWRAGR